MQKKIPEMLNTLILADREGSGSRITNRKLTIILESHRIQHLGTSSGWMSEGAVGFGLGIII